ncbi:general secretion pathway protein GspK [Thermodesulfobacteriota bacterium]
MHNNNRGVALIITLSIIAVLVVTTLELNRKARSSIYVSGAFRERIQLKQKAMSGVHAAMALLVKDKESSNIDSIQEDWANPEKTEELLMEMPFDYGRVRVSIVDELGKIQVNSLVKFPDGRVFNESQRQMWEHFLSLAIPVLDRTDDTAPIPIINSLKDWLDRGDDDLITGLSGAESEYYLDLNPSYECQNGPFHHLGELMLVKGITPDFFEGVGGVPGIASYMTVWGMTESGNNQFTYNGAININTADLPVIAAILPAENEHLAQSIFEYRAELSDGNYVHDLSNPTWYTEAPGCSELEIDPKLIQATSDLFLVRAEAEGKGMTLAAEVVVKRTLERKTGKWHAKILSYQEK